MSVTVWVPLVGAIGATIVGAYFSYRAGKSAALDERDRDIERRLREVELGMVELQVLIRNRREARQRKADRERFHLVEPDDND